LIVAQRLLAASRLRAVNNDVGVAMCRSGAVSGQSCDRFLSSSFLNMFPEHRP
jgi:hypothetical protein